MAVYKATYCYPFLTSYDVRLANLNSLTGQSEKSVKWLSCKIDSSNKDITGYSIRILNEYNEVIFPVTKEKKISPISELKPTLNNGVYQINGVDLINQEWKVNSGLNGTYLNIPFFQTNDDNSRIIKSANAIYSTINYRINYIIRPLDMITEQIRENSDNYNNWTTDGASFRCNIVGWKGTLNGDHLTKDQTVLVIDNNHQGYFCKVVSNSDSSNLEILSNIQFKDLQTILIDQGSYHNQVYQYIGTTRKIQHTPDTFIRYKDIYDNTIDLNNLGSVYKWEITLYQGDGKESYELENTVAVISYEDINKEKYCDMILSEGTVLGTKPGRLQIAYSDNGTVEGEILPQNKDGSGVILYHKWAQLLTENGADASNRFYVNSYDETYGHVYPLESDANTLSLNGVSKIQFFPHSNDPTSITANDRVDVASAITDGQIESIDITTLLPVVSGNIELVGIQDLDGVPGFSGCKVLLMHQKRPEENGVYIMSSDVNNSITVDKLVYKRDTSKDTYKTANGKNLLFSFGWTNTKTDPNTQEEILTSVYTRTRYVRKPVVSGYAGDKIYNDPDCVSDSGLKASEVSMSIWSRAGAFDTWGDFIGKIIYVENGIENGHKNFDSLANVGGQLLVTPYKSYDAQGSYNYDGSSSLYFTNERPILLFSQKLENYNIRACGVKVTTSDSIIYDNVTMQDGQYALQIDNNKASIVKISVTGTTSSSVIIDFDFSKNAPHYFYIEEGQQNGHSVVKVDNKGNATLNNTELYTAILLYNKKERTYISPFTGISEQMLLKFKGDVIKLQDNQYKQNFLSIKTVNKNLWYITHDQLDSPLLSYVVLQNTTSDEIPYKYKLVSFFKTSDENPFYLYEDPYIGIYRTILLEVQDKLSQEFKVLDTNNQEPYVSFDIYNSKKGFKAPNGAEFNEESTKFSTIMSDFLGYSVTPNAEKSVINLPTSLLNNITNTVEIPAHYKGSFLQEPNKTECTTDVIVNWHVNHPNLTSEDKDEFENTYGRLWVAEAEEISFPTDISVEQGPLFANAAIIDLSSGYRLNLTGIYNQQQGGSWEAYRWVVSKPTFKEGYTFNPENYSDALDNIVDETVLQDTGRRYDKEINVNFYGLFTQETEQSVSKTPYIVHLYLEDDLGNTIHKQEIVVVESGSLSSVFSQYLSQFTATFDKCNACVDITINPAWRNSNNELIKLGLTSFSIFKREYRTMYKDGISDENIIVVGDQWYPVALNITVNAKEAASGNINIKVKDYNIKNNYSYQYIIFPNIENTATDTQVNYVYANTPIQYGQPFTSIDSQFKSQYSKPVEINFDYWSLVELIPNEELIDAPVAALNYTINPTNIWLFKYSLDTGSLTQTMAKNEINTLGQFNRYGHGLRNALSGSVSCYLGSEIVPLSKIGYIERMPYARNQPISTNDANAMLLLWRQFAYSKNPKLLRNLKGESWIVQITESANTTNNFIHNYPDTISFSWKQIEKTDTAIISLVNSEFFEQNLNNNSCAPIWEKQSINTNKQQQIKNGKAVAYSIKSSYNINK